MILRSLPALAALLLASGCASVPEGDFPSLAKRPYESSAPLDGGESPPAPDQRAVSPELRARLNGLRGLALAAHERFNARRGAASQAAGGGDWAGAQIALAELESARSEAMVPLADLDRLYIEASNDAVASQQLGDVQAIAAVRAEVSRLIAEQDRVIAEIGRRVG